MMERTRQGAFGQPRPRQVAVKRSRAPRERVLITGGAGFIGTNLARNLAEEDRPVLIFDNLSRPGVEANVKWLHARYGSLIDLQPGDVRDRDAVARAVRHCDLVFHFAAQVAVTTSLKRPEEDFEINARGTLNVLDACCRRPTPPRLLFTSTNKVYGDLKHVPLTLIGERYLPSSSPVRRRGLGETCPLEFHSPYGCSKGTADQYVLDHARCYGLPATVFRMSCIYGPHQCGTEDQGWVAHFARAVLDDRPITVYGDGFQVRDLLFVEDLVRAMRTAIRQIDQTAGRAFNMGGAGKRRQRDRGRAADRRTPRKASPRRVRPMAAGGPAVLCLGHAELRIGVSMESGSAGEQWHRAAL